MPFLFLSNANVKFMELKKLTQKLYTAMEALSTTNQIELINKKEFAKAALNENFETFVVHITTLEVPIAMSIHFFRAPQVQDNLTLAALVQQNKDITKILAKYSDYTNVFSSDLAMELPQNTGTNEHAIELIDGQQLF